jgi:hypothetical protein
MKIIDCKQKDDRWWEVRRGVPTASGFHNIITASKEDFAAAHFKYACRLIADLYDPAYGPQSEWESVSMIQGARLEPEARSYYEFNRNCEVQEVGFVFSDCERFGCSPDSLVGDDGLLELKCPNAHTHVAYLCKEALPDEYRAQCHGQLIVTGREWVDFMSYYPGLPKFLVRVTPDGFTEKLRGYLDKFWDIYQSMRAKVEGGRERLIEQAVSERGDQLPDSLRGLVPVSAQLTIDDLQPF